MQIPSPVCPWSALRVAEMQFCEASRCAWIAQPGNAWSNLAFLVAAALILRTASLADRRLSQAFAAVSVGAGLGSFVYHATNSYAMELVDLASMYALSALMLTLSLGRRLGWSARRSGAVYAAALAASVAAVLIDIDVGNALFGAQLAAATGLEIAAWRRERHGQLRWLGASALLFGVAFAVWNVDYHKLACDPDDPWLNGHAAWHVLSAAALGVMAVFYRQIARLSWRLRSPGAP